MKDTGDEKANMEVRGAILAANALTALAAIADKIPVRVYLHATYAHVARAMGAYGQNNNKDVDSFMEHLEEKLKEYLEKDDLE